MRLTRRGILVMYGVPLALTLVAGLLTVQDRRAPGTPLAVTRPSPSPAASPVVRPSPRAPRVSSPVPVVPQARRAPRRPAYRAGTGELTVVPGSSAVRGRGPLRRFTVEVEGGIGVSGTAFAATVERILFDPRSWVGGGLSFQRVASGPVAFRVVLAGPALTDRLCRPLRTGGIYSCFQRGRAVINAGRWLGGATAYGPDLAGYRVYVVNHEVGHGLGRGHRGCPGRGLPAPVMMQQTKGVGGCRPNPWPLPSER